MLTIEYNRVTEFHRYRTNWPWDRGGRAILRFDRHAMGVDYLKVSDAIVGQLTDRLLHDAKKAGIDAIQDNHIGFTVILDPYAGKPGHTLQILLSDGNVSVWLMPC